MEGKRFGAGLVAGLLMGLLVVVASASFASGTLPFSAVGQFNRGVVTGVTTTTVLSTTTISAQTPQNTGGSPAPSGSNSTYVFTATSTTSSGATPAKAVDLIPAFSSGLQGVARQSPAANFLLFVPLLVAFMLGTAIYVFSRRGNEEPPEEERVQS